jgi:mono/diheme cytochrome c family protein
MKMCRFRVAILLLIGLGAVVQAAQLPEHDARWVAPDRAAAKPNPLAGRPELAAGGHKIFVERCAQCHGKDAQGTSRAPNLLSRRVQAQTDGALFWKISSGDTRRGMPTFSFLPATQRWQLVLYLRGLHEPAARVGQVLRAIRAEVLVQIGHNASRGHQ